MPPLPEIVAHRGTPRDRRENTLAAFALALDQGADGIELDVHATADGVVVVHHDPVLPPGTLPASLVGEPIVSLDWTALAAATLPPGADGGRERIPTLEQALALVAGRAVVYVEIKAPMIEGLVRQALIGSEATVAIHSFDHRVSREVADMERPVPTGVLVYCRLLDPAHALLESGARDYWCWWQFIDAETVEAVHDAGGRVVAWTVNDPADARRLRDLGVDVLCTDLPALVRDALGPS